MRFTHFFILLLFLFSMGLSLCAAPPTLVWVNGAWTGEKKCGGHAWKVDAFPTLAQGLAAVTDGGTVQVAAGVYAERLIITKPVTLSGPQAGVTPNLPNAKDPCAENPARAGKEEAIILPPTSDLSFPTGMLITIQADGVTVDGFTLDGHNPALTKGVTLNGVEGYAAAGIGVDNGKVRQAVIVNNIVHNMYLAGINITVNGAHADGYRLCANRIDNLPIRTDSLPYASDKAVTAYGIRVAGDSFMGEISDNTITRSAVGIHISNLSAQLSEGDGYAPSPVVQRNHISAYYTGVIVNLVFEHFYTGPMVLLADNDVAIIPTTDTVHPDRYGLCLLGIHGSSRVLAIGNRISGGEAGVFVWDSPTLTPTPNIEIDRGSISDAKYGVWLSNYCAFGPGTGSAALIRGTFIRRCTNAGLYVEDDSRGTQPVTASLGNGVRIFDGTRGIVIHGGRANLQLGAGWCSVQLSGQQGDYITLEGNYQTFPGNLDIKTVIFGGGEEYHQATRRSDMTPEQLTALAEKITDAHRDPRLGRIE